MDEPDVQRVDHEDGSYDILITVDGLQEVVSHAADGSVTGRVYKALAQRANG